ncbi:MAG TPA: hypothetical protein VJA25_02590 [Dehalococcoidia bacterium]|nr:hypothetical protein [Dehalococcoidia bacterium]
MPTKVVQHGKGCQVVNSLTGKRYSKKPTSCRKAHIQKWIIDQATKHER